MDIGYRAFPLAQPFGDPLRQDRAEHAPGALALGPENTVCFFELGVLERDGGALRAVA